jgi:hypothetical protein
MGYRTMPAFTLIVLDRTPPIPTALNVPDAAKPSNPEKSLGGIRAAIEINTSVNPASEYLWY